MRTPYFLRLAEIDEQRFISGCRHGLIHLTWGRTTIRFARDEFRRLARLLALAMDTPGPSLLRDGEMQVTYHPQESGEVRIGAAALQLPVGEYAELTRASQEALQRLDEVLASGAWDRNEPEDEAADFWSQLRRTVFSKN